MAAASVPRAMGDQSDVAGSGELVTLETAKLGAQAKSKFLKQGYRLVGDHGHSAVKLCHWTKSAAKGGMACYKNTFYGIASHRCVQMTPSLPSCNYACEFCWRDHFGNTPTLDNHTLDAPGDILEGSLDAQKKLLTGYKGNPYVAYTTWLEAMEPKHIAVSLNGEPTNYPHLGEFFRAAHDKGISTFLVTNGSNPDVIRDLMQTTLPTQIYLSVDGPNEEVFTRTCNPLLPNLWSRFQETVDLFAQLKTRTVLRHTLVKGLNMGWEHEYAAIIARANPMFVESKGYSHMGPSMARLDRDSMPDHEEVRAFTKALLSHLPKAYAFVNERIESRVTLLSRVGQKTQIDGFEANVRSTTAPTPL
jgi:tRNA wybutosine-synthesizing protein 1